MSNLTLEVVEMLGETIVKVIPVTIGLAAVFSVLAHFWACNPGTPRWCKRELVTDVCYWFFVPLFARVLRIGLLVLGAGVIFNIHDPDATDRLLRQRTRTAVRVAALVAGASVPDPVGLHAVLAASDVSWRRFLEISRDLSFIRRSGLDFGARFHPVNLFLGTIGVDVILLMAGISPNVMLWVGPVDDIPFGLRSRQSELGAGALQIRDGDAGVPSLASYFA